MPSKLASVGSALYWVYDRVITALVYFTVFMIITGITVVMIAVPFGDSLPKGRWPVAIILGLSSLPGIAFFYWQFKIARWRGSNPELYAKQKAAEEAARAVAIEEAKAAPLSPFWSVVGSLITGAIYLAAAVGGIYVVYFVMASLPVSVAIILGAVIIGLCILSVKN